MSFQLPIMKIPGEHYIPIIGISLSWISFYFIIISFV